MSTALTVRREFLTLWNCKKSDRYDSVTVRAPDIVSNVADGYVARMVFDVAGRD